MNKEDFKKLVKRYITIDKDVNVDLILKTFDSHKPNNSGTPGATILLENKLLYIPAERSEIVDGIATETIYNLNDDGFGPKNKGTFVFSDGSHKDVQERYMYIYSVGPKKYDDEWYITSGTGWSTKHNWVVRDVPISAMNKGKGWRVSSGIKNYYVLDSSNVHYMLNWTLRNPMEVKE